jgi:hypothetical protein
MRDEGILTFYNLTNVALPGAKPKEKLQEIGIIAYYANKTIGFNRLYAAKGANYKLDKLVRAYATELPESAKYVILEDGRQYRIADMNAIVDEDAIDLSLERLSTNYEVEPASGPVTSSVTTSSI